MHVEDITKFTICFILFLSIWLTCKSFLKQMNFKKKKYNILDFEHNWFNFYHPELLNSINNAHHFTHCKKNRKVSLYLFQCGVVIWKLCVRHRYRKFLVSWRLINCSIGILVKIGFLQTIQNVTGNTSFLTVFSPKMNLSCQSNRTSHMCNIWNKHYILRT